MIDVSASNWSIDRESGEILIDMCKKIQGYWEMECKNGKQIDITLLGPKVGDVGKKQDPNAPMKISDPKMIAKVAEEHPEIAAAMAACSAETSNGNEVITQKSTSATFRGESSFSW